MPMGLIGKKIGMTRMFDSDGTNVPVTILLAGPCSVLKVKTKDSKDGYNAVQLGYEDIIKNEKKIPKPVLGYFKKLNITPKKYIKEFRLTDDEMKNLSLSVGKQFTCDIFAIDEAVDIVGTSKGRGFAGVVKRWNFHGSNQSHGTHEYRRHTGSIGQHSYPARVRKGLKMPGHYGNERVTVQNIKIMDIEKDKNLILVFGSVPGAKNGIVYIKKAVKAR